MATRGTQIIRRKRPRVLVSLKHDAVLETIAALAHAWEWDLLDLVFTRGSVPVDPAPSGALLRCLPTAALAKQLRGLGCPAVRLGRRWHPQDELLPAVLPDLVMQGKLAAEHFAERGFNHIGFVGHDPWSISKDVYDSLRNCSRDLGMTCHLHRFESRRGREGETKAATYERRAGELGKWLKGIPKPVALLTYSDAMAARICTMCEAGGLTVPEDVALLGIGDDQLTCDLSPVALSSVDTDGAEQGRQAAFLLRGLMAGTAPPKAPIMIPPKGVVARRSTEVLAVDEPVVAQALRFLWDHLEQNVSVDAVAAEVGVSRRSLERAFRHDLGRGVNAELRRKRLERCCDLLKTTDMRIADLVPLVGFRSADYLHVAFRKAFGTTPRRWRLQHVG